jgi:transposase
VSSREFVPVALPAAPMKTVAERGIEVELRRGAVTMKITWPSSVTADFAAWTRELLR